MGVPRVVPITSPPSAQRHRPGQFVHGVFRWQGGLRRTCHCCARREPLPEGGNSMVLLESEICCFLSNHSWLNYSQLPIARKSSPCAGPSAGAEVLHAHGSSTFGAFWKHCSPEEVSPCANRCCPWRVAVANCLHLSICACHPCAGAMLIFSVPFKF